MADTLAQGAAGTFVVANSVHVRVGLFQLWAKRVATEQIRVVVVEPITPIGREWGNRGSLRRHGEIFLDAGHSTTRLALHLADGRVIRIGVATPERGREIAELLPQTSRVTPGDQGVSRKVL